MKLFIGLIAAVLLVQALALPTLEDPSKPEHIPSKSVKPINEEVDAFREAVNYRFTRFQIFYDLVNNEMRNYRLNFVEMVSTIGADLMRVFAEDLDYVRESAGYTNNVINDVLAELGGTPNACLTDILNRLALNSGTLGDAVNACAVRTNTTVSRELSEVFYPTFVSIQESVSTVPLLVMEALSRGNAFEDTAEIVAYLESQYQVITLQWLSAVSQLLRWETTRFEVEGRFYIEEMVDCFANPIYQYSNTNTLLMFTAWDTCRP